MEQCKIDYRDWENFLRQFEENPNICQCCKTADNTVYSVSLYDNLEIDAVWMFLPDELCQTCMDKLLDYLIDNEIISHCCGCNNLHVTKEMRLIQEGNTSFHYCKECFNKLSTAKHYMRDEL